MHELVMVRHGQSTWNRENRFTGWVDVGLTEQGVQEAKTAGARIREAGQTFDIAYTSFLKRATETLDLILGATGQTRIPIRKSWRLNERHYGALQGLNKSETASKYGEEQVRIWRRSYDVRPPELNPADPMFPGNDPLYASIPRAELPLAECLKDTVSRVLPYWEKEVLPAMGEGKRPIISASGNSLRAIVMHLDGLTPEQIIQLDLPTGIPLVYELDDSLAPIRHYYLASNDEVRAAIDVVKKQGKANPK